MDWNAWHYPFASRRTVVFAARGMVATSQYLAAQAGLEVMRHGGNAVDAAVAAAATLTVVEPTSNGIGGDAFALVWSGGRLHGLNASGPAPLRLTREALRAAGHTRMPVRGWPTVTVPGTPAAWAALVERFGRLSLAEVVAPAVRYAREGFPVSPVVAHLWAKAADLFQREWQGPEFQPWFDTFAPGGRAPVPGEVWRAPGHARTLELIGASDAEAFYRGELAAAISAFARETGGYLDESDLAAFSPEWVEPLHVTYRGYEVWELPPNGQGVVALQALNILSGFAFAGLAWDEVVHKQIEAIKLAFADARQHLTDPRWMRIRPERWLTPAYAAQRRALIGEHALDPVPGRLDAGGTVYLATADAEGNMVSYIQSNYLGFGSGVVVPGTGIALHNRGAAFSLAAEDSNVLVPGKRPYHTIIPGFLTKDGQALGPFGVMGAYMQPQGHVQVVMNLVDFHLNPQSALDAPRWQWLEGRQVAVEREFPAHVAQALERRGHAVQVANDRSTFGRGQVILRLPSGVLAAGTEPRADGAIAAW
ncbi:MAG: gamma-glutamyltransferase family protein [Alicyclobacillus sp.]|nr:gamma-glutamyltransferase family protein [Alicyclobacillus sp.]